jgi:Ataxin-3
MKLASLSSGRATWIYHERQESLLCGQHCLNSLLQIPDSFTPQSLSEIALNLDSKESGIGARALGGESQNVSEDGNFSIQVLTVALKSFGVDLLNWKSESFKGKNPMDQSAFVVNRQSHWFTIRKIGKTWWNLNSALERPEPVGEFYLSASLDQLHTDGYTIFIAKGNVPPGGTKGEESYASEKGMASWWEEDVLMRPPEEKREPEQQKIDPFAGQGNRMVPSNTVDDATIAALAAEAEAAGDFFDPDMARAIALSMQEQAPRPPQSKEEMRAARLAAMAARGLS